jgi:hypothetical protein
MTPLGWFLVSYYGLAVLWGAHSAAATPPAGGDLVFQIALALCLGIWAVADAHERGSPIPRSQRIWFLLLARLVVPGYVIVTRGWQGLGWVVLHLIGWIVVATLAMNFTGFLNLGDAWWKTIGFE